MRFVDTLCADLDIRGLGALGLHEEAMPGLARKAAGASSMRGNPVVLEQDELVAILRRAMGQAR
jgi:alcohol dehydrogenase class IV